MKDSSISKYHLFSGVSVMVIAYLTLTTVVLYLKCFKLYVPGFLDALRTQGMSANMYSDLFLIVFPAVILLLLYVVSFHFSYQYFGVLYLTQEGVLLKAPFKRRIYIPYPEIRELGIDVGTTKQFWIFISKQKPTECISTGSTRSAVPSGTNGLSFHTLISCAHAGKQIAAATWKAAQSYHVRSENL